MVNYKYEIKTNLKTNVRFVNVANLKVGFVHVEVAHSLKQVFFTPVLIFVPHHTKISLNHPFPPR